MTTRKSQAQLQTAQSWISFPIGTKHHLPRNPCSFGDAHGVAYRQLPAQCIRRFQKQRFLQDRENRNGSDDHRGVCSMQVSPEQFCTVILFISNLVYFARPGGMYELPRPAGVLCRKINQCSFPKAIATAHEPPGFPFHDCILYCVLLCKGTGGHLKMGGFGRTCGLA